MKQRKDMKSDNLDLACSSSSFQNFVDLTSVAACFFTIFWLIYMTFVKDSVDILVYATVKYARRFLWLHRILGTDKLWNHNTAGSPVRITANTLKSDKVVNEVLSLPKDSTCSITTKKQYLRRSPSSTPLSATSTKSVNPRRLDFNYYDEINFQNVDLKSAQNYEGKFQNVDLQAEQNCEINFPNHDLKSAEMCETNFQNVDLRSAEKCETDTVFESTEQQPHSKPNDSKWNFSKIKFLYSFRSQSDTLVSPNCVKMKCENLVAKVRPVQVEDKEVLMTSEESAGQVGCCDLLFHFFKSKFQGDVIASSPMPYKRF